MKPPGNEEKARGGIWRVKVALSWGGVLTGESNEGDSTLGQGFWGTSDTGMGIYVRTAPDRKHPSVNLCSVSIVAQNQADINEMANSWKKSKGHSIEATQQEWVWLKWKLLCLSLQNRTKTWSVALRANCKAQVKDRINLVFHSSIPLLGAAASQAAS